MNSTLLQEKQIAAIARKQVALALREIMSDSDAGLVLRHATIVRLKKSVRSKQAGRLRNIREVLEHYKS